MAILINCVCYFLLVLSLYCNCTVYFRGHFFSAGEPANIYVLKHSRRDHAADWQEACSRYRKTIASALNREEVELLINDRFSSRFRRVIQSISPMSFLLPSMYSLD
ncbi:hypothetical protein FKM82_001079 [Ascaphus truei]